jgi:hypothetical protein
MEVTPSCWVPEIGDWSHPRILEDTPEEGVTNRSFSTQII